LACKRNEPDADTLDFWNKIKNLGAEGPKILAEDIVFIAVRATEEAEDYLMDKHGINNFGIRKIREEGIPSISKKVLQVLASCDQIYISFDVDSLDSSISRGTGTPVAEGLTVEEAILLNTELIKDKRVCCWEIVEVNPTLDTENLMAENAFEVLESTTLSLLANF
jgi:arginase